MSLRPLFEQLFSSVGSRGKRGKRPRKQQVSRTIGTFDHLETRILPSVMFVEDEPANDTSPGQECAARLGSAGEPG